MELKFFMDWESKEWQFPRCVNRTREGFRAVRGEDLTSFLTRNIEMVSAEAQEEQLANPDK